MKNSNLKKYQDVKLQNFVKDHKLENELGADYFEITSSDINTNKSKTNKLVELSEESLKSQYPKSKN